MKSILKNSLLMLAVAVATVAQGGTAMAQIVDGNGNVVSALPATADVGEVNAIIDLASGNVSLQIGGGLQVFGIETLNVTGFFDNAAATAAPNGLQAIDPPPPFPEGLTQGPGTQNDAGGIGVLNVGFLPIGDFDLGNIIACLLYTSPSPRDRQKSRMPSSA